MSMYLFDEQPIVANKTLAREIGLNEALILQQINYWIEINKKSGNNFYDGRYWTYNSIRAWQEKAMPNALGQNPPMEKCKIHQCVSADCTDATEPNPPMQNGNMPQPLPEITTNNSSKITTDISSYNSPHHSIMDVEYSEPRKRMDGEAEIENQNIYQNCLDELRTQTGYYEHLELGNKFIVKDFDEILKILADIMILDDREFVTINQTKLPTHIVKERFRKLRSEHLEYLSDVIKENEYKIRNIRAFVLTAAYNAPSGIDAHYSALVSYDMRGAIW